MLFTRHAAAMTTRAAPATEIAEDAGGGSSDLPVWVINLARSPTRWQHMQAMLKRLGVTAWQRLEAIDGQQLSDQVVVRHYDAQRNRKGYFVALKRAEIACCLSHRKAWQALLESDSDSVCILEDDVEFLAPPQAVLRAIQTELECPSARLIKIYAARAQRSSASEPSKLNSHALLQPAVVPLGMQAICLNRAAAQALLTFTERFFEPIDVALQRHWDHGVQIQILQPNLVREVSAQLGGTTLHNQQRQTLAQRVKRELGRPVFRCKRWFQSSLGLWR